MRIKANFTVFPRKMPSGRTVFYFQCYDEQGVRQNGRSTGCSKKTEANAYCMRLYRAGALVPKKRTMTFEEFALGWWDIKTCKYLGWRQLSDPLSENTIDLNRDNTQNYLKGFFGPFHLGDITAETVKAWVLDMDTKKLSASTINSALKTMRLMLDEALNRGLITSNAAKEVKELKAKEVERVILTREEMGKLFPTDWKSVWDDEVIYKINLLASCTGMRIGEVRGLQGKYVFDDYIYVCGQYTHRHGYKPETKTKRNRTIPITGELRRELDSLLKANGDGYVFSVDGGLTPLAPEKIYRGYDKALGRIGIDHSQRLERNLSFHAWRHFFNTALRMENVTDAKVQEVTGHLTQKETDHYTHFDTRQFAEVRNVQSKLLTGKPGKKPVGKKQQSAKGKADVKKTGKRKPLVKQAKAGKKKTTGGATA
ncbi:MAG: tyrosine-type recombinase/integrase [Treponema sp.]|jgi:integrase|nr:tyrosine-type recombinase/integrase [Treponema sp.]